MSKICFAHWGIFWSNPIVLWEVAWKRQQADFTCACCGRSPSKGCRSKQACYTPFQNHLPDRLTIWISVRRQGRPRERGQRLSLTGAKTAKSAVPNLCEVRVLRWRFSLRLSPWAASEMLWVVASSGCWWLVEELFVALFVTMFFSICFSGADFSCWLNHGCPVPFEKLNLLPPFRIVVIGPRFTLNLYLDSWL